MHSTTTDRQPVSLIPVFAGIAREMLDRAYALRLDSKQVEHVAGIDFSRYMRHQKQAVRAYQNQCQQWRLESLSVRDQEWLDDIEVNLACLNELNESLLCRAELETEAA